jgi:hypothetical protein
MRIILSRRGVVNIHILLVILTLLLWPARTFAQANPEGHWEGAITLPGHVTQLTADA